MVQSLGISVGNANSYVAAGQAGGIEILLNEYSNRLTPSMVAFTDQFRTIGVDAASNFFMNFNNTVYDLMILLGKSFADVQFNDSNGHPNYSFKIEEGPSGQVLVVVKLFGEERKFTVTQVLAMLFTKLRSISGDAVDCVLSCPQYFNQYQKLNIMQAALIAGLNPMQVITDMSAVVLNYAYYRTTKDDPDKVIAFVNFGQSNFQAALVWMTPKDDQVKILSEESVNIGGRDFDRFMANHFINKHSLELAPKAFFKLVSACEKVKKNLSANTNEIPISVESLISDEKDFNSRIDRATFEDLIEPLLKELRGCLERALEKAQKQEEITEFEISAVEVVGGSNRIPCIQQMINDVFKIVPSRTLNTDEAVARGCVLHCATLHPGMIVKRQVRILNHEMFARPSDLTCDRESRRIELELINADRNYRNRSEARNNLEEFIYVERSKLAENDPFYNQLSDGLTWLFSDEGEEALEATYHDKLTELKNIRDARLSEGDKSSVKKDEEAAQQQPQQPQQDTVEIEMEQQAPPSEEQTAE